MKFQSLFFSGLAVLYVVDRLSLFPIFNTLLRFHVRQTSTTVVLCHRKDSFKMLPFFLSRTWKVHVMMHFFEESTKTVV
jgi:hypothetical protein